MDDAYSYLDHAATSFPRPPEVLKQMLTQFAAMGCSPGRGGYDMAMEAEAVVQRVRRRLASFFGAESPDRVVFAANATDALNLAIMGLTRPGTHVVSTRMEHNSVLRPLFHLKQTGRIDYTLVDFDNHGFVNPVRIAAALRPNTGLVVVNHASNVLGTVQPIDTIGQICAGQGIPLLIDVAQSAGYVPIHMTAWKVSALAFTGHKALLGPTGIGGLIASPHVDITPTRFGGTGVDSHILSQPLAFPQRLEAGTLNVLGIMGLNAGLDYVEKIGLLKNHRHKMGLLSRLYQQLSAMDRVTVYGSYPDDRHVPVLSFNIQDISPQDAGTILDGDYDIAVRAGLHCAPLLHEDIGTSPRGAVRVSLGWNTTEAEIDKVVSAVADMAIRK
jgi:cysteine desulfurase / selenocysteine lyase